MFADTDRRRLFTRDDMAARLVRTCSVERFFRAYRVPTLCKGRVIAGADLLRAVVKRPRPEFDAGAWHPPATMRRNPPRPVRKRADHVATMLHDV